MGDIDLSSIELDPEALLLRINSGEKLSDKQVREIVALLDAALANQLPREVSYDDIYAFLMVVGRAHILTCQGILERFLDSQDALTVAMVLETLCGEWKLTEEYLERVINFAMGVSWDDDHDVQQSAIKILGAYLHDSLFGDTANGIEALSPCQVRVLDLLFSVFQDRSVEFWARQAAYFALLRAAGLPWDDIPADCVQLKLDGPSAEVDHKVLDKLRRRCLANKPQSDESFSFTPLSSSSPSTAGTL